MPDYSKSKVYAIRSKSTDDIYIGSTILPLSTRLAQHHYDYKGWLEGLRHYVSSFHMLDFEDHYIELIENYPCKSKEELEKKEREVIQKNPNCCNKKGVIVERPVLPPKPKELRFEQKEEPSYYERNREKCLQQSKEYQEANKEYYKQYNREYYLKKKALMPPKPPKAPKAKPERKPKKEPEVIVYLRPQLPAIQPLRTFQPNSKMFEVSFD